MDEMTELAAKRNFRDAFCQRYKCKPEQFVWKVFWRCIHRRCLPLVILFRLMGPGFFRVDLMLIEEAGNAEGRVDIQRALNGFREDCRTRPGTFHDDLRIRVSGKRLYRLFFRTMHGAHRSKRQ
ncbi:MAG: hypothetical protein M1608_05470 [Candidatus Omnitrophica bacterium]|nr:hypothetical protein [Candidatus Omnitrophota bacterium]